MKVGVSSPENEINMGCKNAFLTEWKTEHDPGRDDRPSACYENADHTETFFNFKWSTSCSAEYPCLCEQTSYALTGYHQWVTKFDCPQLGAKWERVQNVDMCAKLHWVSNDLASGTSTRVTNLAIASGTMSSVFDSNKPVGNCFDGVLTATGDYICKTQGSEQSWTQFVLERRVYSDLHQNAGRSSNYYLHYIEITNSKDNPSGPGHFDLKYQGEDDVWRPCPFEAVDATEIALENLGASGCTPTSPCSKCQGDCDTDADCLGLLKCFQREVGNQVPGCSVGGSNDVNDYDYCFNPLVKSGSPYYFDPANTNTMQFSCLSGSNAKAIEIKLHAETNLALAEVSMYGIEVTKVNEAAGTPPGCHVNQDSDKRLFFNADTSWVWASDGVDFVPPMICTYQLDDCSNQLGTANNGDSQTECQCSSNVCMSLTGMYCSSGICSLSATCADRTGINLNTGDCQCGAELCTSTNGLYCAGEQCALTKSCEFDDGSQVNSASCKCGSNICTTSTGLFCDAEGCSRIASLDQLFSVPSKAVCTEPNPTSCQQWKDDRSATSDGGYLVDVLLLSGQIAIDVTVYCHNMNTATPTQWMVLPKSGATNFNTVAKSTKCGIKAKLPESCTTKYQAIQMSTNNGQMRLHALTDRTFADDPLDICTFETGDTTSFKPKAEGIQPTQRVDETWFYFGGTGGCSESCRGDHPSITAGGSGQATTSIPSYFYEPNNRETNDECSKAQIDLTGSGFAVLASTRWYASGYMSYGVVTRSEPSASGLAHQKIELYGGGYGGSYFPEVTPTYTLLKSGQQCSSGNSAYKRNSQTHFFTESDGLERCARECRARTNCFIFLWANAVSTTKGKCVFEATSDATCSEGWVDGIAWDAYEVFRGNAHTIQYGGITLEWEKQWPCQLGEFGSRCDIEWTLEITSQDITENAGVLVSQGSATGTLRTLLNGATTEIVIQTAVGVTFVDNINVVIGGTTTVDFGNINTASNSQQNCQSCPLGRYGDEYGLYTTCKSCPAGKSTESIGLTSAGSCTTCEAGKYRSDSEAACTSCPQGTFLMDASSDNTEHDASSDCTDCAAGLYGPLIGATLCFPCPGQDPQVAKADTCAGYCAPGKFKDDGACTECSGGTFTGAPEMESCSSCPSGWHTTTSPYTSCDACPRGKHGNAQPGATGNTVCVSCIPGKYSSVDGLNNGPCSNCGMGKWSDTTGAVERSTCEGCGIGKYSSVTGADNPSVCLSCEAGTYLDATGSDNSANCKSCPAGYMGEHDGQPNCQPCGAGRFQYSPSQKDCDQCAFGQYRSGDDLILTTCNSCPKGFVQGKQGQASCFPCQSGQYQANKGTSACRLCLAGKYLEHIEWTFEIESQDFTQVVLAEGTIVTQENVQGSLRIELTGVTTNVIVTAATGATFVTSTDLRIQNNIQSEPDTVIDFANINSATITTTNCLDCPSGFVQDRSSASSCLKCARGTYQETEGQTSCKQCSRNRFSVNESSIVCTQCPAGFISSAIGAITCQACEVGKYRPDERTETCILCEKGKYRGSNDASTVCQDCAVGTYQDQVGQISCITCTPGQYQPATTSDSCIDCAKGKYRSSSVTAAIDCQSCPIGKYQESVGQISCTSCVPGTIAPDASSDSCLDCPINFFAEDSESSVCTKCSNAMTTNGKTGAPVCMHCPVGTAGSLCEKCLPGFYRGNEDVECLSCLPGYYSVAAAQPFCLQCDLGKYSNSTATVHCNQCKNDQYQDEPRKTSCKYCKEGKIPNNRSTACESPPWISVGECAKYESGAAEYLNNTSVNKLDWTCVRCPDGSDCRPSENTALSLKPLPEDWWRTPWDQDPTYAKCPFRGRCNIHGCTNITMGPACALCKPGYYKETNGECLVCKGTTVYIRAGIIGGSLLCVFLLLFSLRHQIARLRRKYASAWRDCVRILTIQLSFAQINSSLPMMIQVAWPKEYLVFLEQFNWVNIDVVSLLGMKCVGGDFWDFRMRLVLACAVPPAVAILATFIYCFRENRVKARAKEGTSSLEEMQVHSIEYIWDMFDLDESGEIDEDEFLGLLRKLTTEDTDHDVMSSREIMKDMAAVKRNKITIDGEHAHELILHRPTFVEAAAHGTIHEHLRNDWVIWAERQRIREHYLSDMLLVLFLLHAPLSQRAFYFFACTPVGSKQFLQADYSIECFYDKHLTFVPLASGFLFLFTFLFPFIIFAQLLWNHKHLHSPEIRHRFGFLYVAFQRGAEYWELHELTRKATLTGVLVFIPSSSRAAFAVCVCVITCTTVTYFKPHRSHTVFLVELGSFMLTTFKYISIILMQNRDEDSIDGSVLGYLLVSIDIVYLAGSCLCMIVVLYVLETDVRKAGKNLETTVLNAATATTKVVPLTPKLGKDTATDRTIIRTRKNNDGASSAKQQVAINTNLAMMGSIATAPPAVDSKRSLKRRESRRALRSDGKFAGI
jgi:hypothetical protein